MSQESVQFVLRGARLNFLLRTAGLGISFLAQSIFAGLLGKEQYSIYVVALAWVSVLALFSTLGLDALLTRYLAAYRGNGEWGNLRGLMAWSLRGAVLGSSLVVGLAAVVLFSVRTELGEERWFTLALGLPLIAVLTHKSVLQGTLRGLMRVVQAGSLDSLLRPVVMLLLVLLAVRVGGLEARARLLMGANLAAATLALLVAMFLARRAWPAQARSHAPERHPAEWRRVALPLLVTSGIYLVLSRTDILMLGFLGAPNSAAVYSVITRFSDIMMLGLMSSTAMIGPVAAALHRRGERAKLQAIVTKAVQWSSLLTALIGLVLVVFGRPLLALFGDGYTEGYAPMLILLGGQGANALAGPVGYLLSMTGHQTQVMRVLGISALVNLLLNGALIPLLGVTGAAAATALTNLAWNLVLLFAVRRQLGIDSTALGRAEAN